MCYRCKILSLLLLVTTIHTHMSNASQNGPTQSLLSATSSCTDQTTTPLQNVTIYYEAMEVQSQLFFNTTLPMLYDEFSSYFSFVFLPCQHVQVYFKQLYCFSPGDGGCFLNKVHACAIAQVADNKKLVKFLICTMTTTKVLPNYENCATTLGISVENLTDCANSDVGVRLCMYYRLKKKPGLPNFPSFIFDTDLNTLEGYDDFISKSLLADFKTGLCNKLKTEKKTIPPKNCDNKLNFEIFYNSMQAESQQWFNTVLKDIFEKFGPYVNFKFVPCQAVKMKNDELDCGESIDNTCMSGRFHSCAIRLATDQSSLFKFLLCTMAGVDKLADFQKCATTNNLDYTSIQSCAGSDCGKRLCFDNSLRVSDSRDIPSFVYNGVFIDEISKMTFSDLQLVLCQQLLQHDKLLVAEICKAPPFKLSIFYDGLDQNFQKWASTTFIEYYDLFSPFVQFSFYPCRGTTVNNQILTCDNILDPNCLTNKVHSCIISQAKDSLSVAKFIFCASQDKDENLPNYQSCCEAIKIDYATIMQCANSENGIKLCTDNKGKGPQDYQNLLTYSINDKWDQLTSELIQNNYLQGLCQMMIDNKVPRPNICYTLSSPTSDSENLD